MKHAVCTLAISGCLLLLGLWQQPAAAQANTAFTYQGQLQFQGAPAQGSYDFQFALFDQATGGGSLATPLSIYALQVTDGLFAASLDFGQVPFDGQAVWLEVRVREAGGTSFEPLTPRQPIETTPYSIRALESETAGAVAWPNISSRPVGLDDGDNDTLASLFCAETDVARRINGSWTCAAPLVEQLPQSICIRSDGTSGTVIDGVCVLDYDNSQAVVWNTAVASCIAQGGDLCSASQYDRLRNSGDAVSDLFYSNRPVWSSGFSDNDGGTKTASLQSSDNPSVFQSYSYACCGNATPEPTRSQATTVNGALLTYLHDREDTTWPAAARICQARASDLCSKSQYVLLNDADLFTGDMSRATRELSDNDSGTFDDVVGANTADNPNRFDLFAFACCGNARTSNQQCLLGDQVLQNGLCVAAIHDTEDTNFFNAARACGALNADVCSKSQMQALRNEGLFSGKVWTNDGADNDGSGVGGLLSTQSDNPDPANDLFGYACCR